MQRPLAHKAAILGLLVVFSCDDSVAPQDSRLTPLAERDVDAAFQTDSLNYYLREINPNRGPEAMIAIQYRNMTEWPVQVDECAEKQIPFWLEKRIGDRWIPAYFPQTCSGRYRPELVLEVGQTFAGFFTIWDCQEQEYNCYPRFEVDTIPGDYRFVFIVRRVAGDTLRPVPKAEEVSNVFRLHGPDFHFALREP